MNKVLDQEDQKFELPWAESKEFIAHRYDQDIILNKPFKKNAGEFKKTKYEVQIILSIVR